MPLSLDQKLELSRTANLIRQRIITMLSQAGSGHSGGALGLADLYTALYFHILNHRPSEPTWSGRDYLLVSNGHTVPVWYTTLATAGYFPLEELTTLRKLNSRLQGHPWYHSVPGLENTSGSLGQGLSQALGIALGLRLDGAPNKVHCIMSDAEQQEGQIWEAYMFAAHHQLDNVVAWVDRNHIQIGGTVETQLSIEPFADKVRSFSWHVQQVNGHRFSDLVEAYDKTLTIPHRPHLIICHTVPGKGVPEMEGDYHWHGDPPSPELAQTALTRLVQDAERLPHE